MLITGIPSLIKKNMFGTGNRIVQNGLRGFSAALTDDTDVGLVVRYVGAQKSATVTVAAAGDITFKHGAAAAEVADTTIQIGATPGMIDVSNSAGNTMALVVDAINKSANWKAYIKDALRADSSDASTGSLLAMAETTISPLTDLPLYKDTSKVLNLSIRVGIRQNATQTSRFGAAEIFNIVSKNTFGSGTSLIQIYRVNEQKKTETKIFERSGAATTVEQALSFVVNGMGSYSSNVIGEHLLVRIIGSAACTGYLQTEGRVSSGF